MVWRVNGRNVIKRASFHRQGDEPRVTTATGVEFAMSENALLRRARRRGWDIRVEPHLYGGPKDHYITHTVGKKDGRTIAYKYETMRFNGAVRVTTIHGGHRNATRLVEGCS